MTPALSNPGEARRVLSLDRRGHQANATGGLEKPMSGRTKNKIQRNHRTIGIVTGAIGLVAAASMVAPQAFGTAAEAPARAEARSLDTATAIDAETPESEFTYEQRVALAGTGDLNGRQVFVEIYGNSLYRSQATLVIEQPGGRTSARRSSWPRRNCSTGTRISMWRCRGTPVAAQSPRIPPHELPVRGNRPARRPTSTRHSLTRDTSSTSPGPTLPFRRTSRSPSTAGPSCCRCTMPSPSTSP